MEHAIEFNAEEMELRTIVHEGVVKLVSRNQAKEGKQGYSDLLKQKINAIVPAKYAISDGFKTFKEKRRAYIWCEHNKRMPIWYESAKLKENEGLTFHWTSLCEECLSQHQISSNDFDFVSSLTSNATTLDHGETSTVRSVSKSTKQNTKPTLSQLLDEVARDIANTLKTVKEGCMKYPDPAQNLIDQTAEFGVLINNVAIKALKKQSIEPPHVENQCDEQVEIERDEQAERAKAERAKAEREQADREKADRQRQEQESEQGLQNELLLFLEENLKNDHDEPSDSSTDTVPTPEGSPQKTQLSTTKIFLPHRITRSHQVLTPAASPSISPPQKKTRFSKVAMQAKHSQNILIKSKK